MTHTNHTYQLMSLAGVCSDRLLEDHDHTCKEQVLRLTRELHAARPKTEAPRAPGDRKAVALLEKQLLLAAQVFEKQNERAKVDIKSSLCAARRSERTELSQHMAAPHDSTC